MALKVFDGYGKIGLDVSPLTRGLGTLQNTMTSKLGMVGRLASTAIKTIVASATAAAVAITGVIVKSVFEFAKLEKGVAEIITLFGKLGSVALPKLQANITSIVRTLARDFGQRIPDAIKGAYDAVSAGIKKADIGKFMQDSAKLAIAGVTDIATSVDLLTSTLNAFGMKAKDAVKVSDALFATVKAGKTTIGELSSQIGFVGPVARAAGVSLNEMLAAVAAMTKQGISTSEATTALSAALSNILKPSKEAADAAERLGISFDAETLKAKGFKDFMQDVGRVAGKSTKDMAELFGSVRSLKGILAITSEEGFLDFNKTLAEVNDSTGATKRAFETMEDTISTKMDKIKGKITTTWQTIGSYLADDAITVLETVDTAFVDNEETIQRWSEGFGENVSAFVGKVSELTADGTLDRWLTKIGEGLENLGKKETWDNLWERLIRVNPIITTFKITWKAVAVAIDLARTAWDKLFSSPLVNKALYEWELLSNRLLLTWKQLPEAIEKVKNLLHGANDAFWDFVAGGTGVGTSRFPSPSEPAGFGDRFGKPQAAGGNMNFGAVTVQVNSTAPAADVGRAVAKALLDLRRVGGYSQGGVAVMP